MTLARVILVESQCIDHCITAISVKPPTLILTQTVLPVLAATSLEAAKTKPVAGVTTLPIVTVPFTPLSATRESLPLARRKTCPLSNVTTELVPFAPIAVKQARYKVSLALSVTGVALLHVNAKRPVPD